MKNSQHTKNSSQLDDLHLISVFLKNNHWYFPDVVY